MYLRLAAQRKKAESGAPLDSSWDKYRALGEQQILDALRAEMARREAIHRRAQAFLGTMAVMSAFTLGAVGFFRAERFVVPNWFLACCVVSVMIFLAAGAWFALRIVAPDRYYDLNILNRMGDEGPLSDVERLDVILQLVQFNQAHNLIYSIDSIRCYRCVRNGVVALVFSLGLLVGDAALLKICP